MSYSTGVNSQIPGDSSPDTRAHVLDDLDIGSGDPLTTLSLARVLLDEVRAGRRPGALRIYRPEPTAAFGARDRFLPGFPEAVARVRELGFTPVLRSLGGRLAVYHPGSLVIDHVEPAHTLLGGNQARFEDFGRMYTEALRGLGLDARLGEIPGEYCPGEHSINVGGRIKAVGTAQRVTNTGWLFSSSVVVTDPDPVREVLTAAQEALGVEWDPATGGAMSEEEQSITVDAVEQAFRTAYAARYALRPSSITPAEVAAASPYDERYRLG